MRRLGTWAVLTAVAAIGLLAAIDSLRAGGARETRAADPSPRARGAPPPIPGREALSARLRVAGVEGSLYFTDRRCRPWILRLPTLEWAWTQSGIAPECRFALSPSGESARFGRAAWAPSGVAAAVDLTSLERGPLVEVSAEPTGWSHRFEGRNPAFTPDGALTFVRDGELWEWSADCLGEAEAVLFRGRRPYTRCETRLFSRADAGALMRPRFGRSSLYAIEEVVWPRGGSAAAILQGRVPDEEVVALIAEGRREVVHVARPGLSDLQLSPRGTHVAAVRGHAELRVLRLDGARLPLPPRAARADAVAWSPDERWLALAGREGVWIVRAGEGTRAVVRLPFGAADVAWR